MFVPRVAPLGDHSFPALQACALPWLWIGEPSHPLHWGKEHERIEHRSALLEWQFGQVASIQPGNIEHVIGFAVTSPRELAVKNEVCHVELGDRGLNWRAVLRQPVPREQADLTALAKHQEPNAVEFALENPFRP